MAATGAYCYSMSSRYGDTSRRWWPSPTAHRALIRRGDDPEDFLRLEVGSDRNRWDRPAIGVAVLGMGNVGAEVVRILERTPTTCDLRGRAAGDPRRGSAGTSKPRKIDSALLTTDAAAPGGPTASTSSSNSSAVSTRPN